MKRVRLCTFGLRCRSTWVTIQIGTVHSGGRRSGKTGTVPDGASEGQARAIATLLGDSGLVTSLDLVELNPRLDPDGRSAAMMRDLATRMLPPRAALQKTGS